jgi:hypothetical protein
VVAVLPHVLELRTQQIGSVTQRPDLCRQCGLGNLRAVLRCIALATRAFVHWGIDPVQLDRLNQPVTTNVFGG